jgi:hypothetical protein
VMSIEITWYGKPISSSMMEILRPFGVVHVYRSITIENHPLVTMGI